MEVTALNIIRRVDILQNLIKVDNGLLFEKTATNFITENILDNYENSCYQEALKLFQCNKIADTVEVLATLRTNNLLNLFANPCDKKWNSLIATNNSDIRFCGDCKRNVFKVYNKEDYRKRKQLNQCVAISFYLEEQVIESTSCEFTEYRDFELLGSPSTID